MKIHIIGGPGTGKTYLAKKLAEELKIPHYDLDNLQWDDKAGTYGVKRNPKERDELLNEIKADSVMIGDRNQDVNGAHQVGIECIGVRYGYAKPDELEDAGVDYIVETIPELTALILAQ